MVNDLTISILATSSRAGVEAFEPQTGLVGHTIGINRALRATSFVGVSNIVGNARAGAYSVSFFTNGVGSTGGRHTGIDWREICSNHTTIHYIQIFT